MPMHAKHTEKEMKAMMGGKMPPKGMPPKGAMKGKKGK